MYAGNLCGLLELRGLASFTFGASILRPTVSLRFVNAQAWAHNIRTLHSDTKNPSQTLGGLLPRLFMSLCSFHNSTLMRQMSVTYIPEQAQPVVLPAFLLCKSSPV